MLVSAAVRSNKKMGLSEKVHQRSIATCPDPQMGEYYLKCMVYRVMDLGSDGEFGQAHPI